MTQRPGHKEYWNGTIWTAFKIKWTDEVTNQEVFELIGVNGRLVNNILRRKDNWIEHILRRNCLLHDSI